MQADFDRLALSLASHYWPLTEQSGTLAKDLVGGVDATWGADVSGFLTTGPDGVASAPVNNGSTTRVAINNTGFAPPAKASWFCWLRYDVNANDDSMAFEMADSPTFNNYIQMNYSGSNPTARASFLIDYGNAVSGERSSFGRDTADVSTVTNFGGPWGFYVCDIDTTLTGVDEVKVYRNLQQVGQTDNGTGTQDGRTPGTMKVGILGRNNNGTRALPVKGALQGLGVFSGVLTAAQKRALFAAMLAPRESAFGGRFGAP